MRDDAAERAECRRPPAARSRIREGSRRRAAIVAWQEFMAPDAAKPANGGRMLIGPQEIGDNMLAALRERLHAVVGADARRNLARRKTRLHVGPLSLGLSTGKAREGTYMTVWEKQPDGTWKVLFDTGDPD